MAPDYDVHTCKTLCSLAVLADCYGTPSCFTTTLKLQPNSFYHRTLIEHPDVYNLLYVVSAHGFSHDWFIGTVTNAGSNDGFYYAPWLGHSFPQQVLAQDGPQRRPGPEQLTNTDVTLNGFTTFGSVAISGDVYTIRESVDAGIFKTMILPVGSERLDFRYRFVAGGDGDFLSVHWGTNAVLYVGPDLPISRTNFISASVSMSDYQNDTNEMVFKLVSRGATNGVLILDSLTLSINPDPDGDGLTTEEEAGLGTNPQSYDTDADGLTDWEEVNTYQTNPILWDTDGDGISDGQEVATGTDPTSPASVFKFTNIQRNPNGSVTLQWSTVTNKLYSINRSLTPSRADYTTLTNGVPGMPPLNSFTDSPATNGASFYWIETE